MLNLPKRRADAPCEVQCIFPCDGDLVAPQGTGSTDYCCASSDCSTGCSTALPSSALRAPFQPVSGSGSLALSLNGSSTVSDRQPKAWVMCGEPMVSVSSVYGV